MAPSYKLIYFDGRGRGEISRLCFAFSKKKWEDKRIEFSEWPEWKPKTPLGSLPVLEVDGKMYSQGIAIASYLAKEFGLMGKSNVDAMMIDMIQLTREDLLTQEAKMMFEKDEAAKAEITKKLVEDVYPKIFNFFEKQIKDNKSGFSVGSKLTVADLAIFVGTETANEKFPNVLETFPCIGELRKKVASTPGIKEYLATRKETPF